MFLVSTIVSHRFHPDSISIAAAHDTQPRPSWVPSQAVCPDSVILGESWGMRAYEIWPVGRIWSGLIFLTINQSSGRIWSIWSIYWASPLGLGPSRCSEAVFWTSDSEAETGHMWMDFSGHVPLAKKTHHWPTWKWGLSIINLPENQTQIRLCQREQRLQIASLDCTKNVSTQLEMASIFWQIKTMGKFQMFTVKLCSINLTP